MKRLLPVLLCAFFLTACGANSVSTQPSFTIPATAPTETIPICATEPAEETVAPTADSTESTHSALYIPDTDVEDVITWFNEVCLAAEFINSGDPSFLQKWDCPIFYMIYGEPTDDDLAILESFVQWLNTLEGFPGICEAANAQEANLNIHFCTHGEMLSIMGEWTYDLDGAVTFWYDNDRIYDAIVCVRTDLNQHLRNSAILEELYNGLGPIQDTSLRPDSLIYGGYSEPQELTKIDKLILQLLYHPDMKCGMDSTQCEEVIRSIYY